MSQTLNNITMLAALGEITKSDAQLQDYVAKTASHLAAQGKPFREVPELFTETLMAERLDILKSSRGGQEFARKLMNTDLSDDLDQAGISRDDLSQTEMRQLQVTKLFKESFAPESPNAFAQVLQNARENLYGHLQGQRDAQGKPMEGRSLPPSVVYSMAFGEGRGFGVREPDAEQLKQDMWDNAHIQDTMSKVVEAHDAFYKAQGMESKAKEVIRGMADRVRQGLKEVNEHPFRAAASVFFATAAISMMSLDGSKEMDAESAHNIFMGGQAESLSEMSFPADHEAYTVNVSVSHGQTASEMASDILKAVGVSPTKDNRDAMLAASNLPDPDKIYANTIVDFKLPVTGELSSDQVSALSKVSDSLSYSGHTVITAHIVNDNAKESFINNLERSRDRGSDLSM